MEPQFQPLSLPELIQRAKQEVYAELNRKKPKTREEAPHQEVVQMEGGGIPDCLKYILTAHPKTDNTNFNRLTTNLVMGFQRAGYKYQDALMVAKTFLEKYPHSTEYTTREDRIDHFQSQWAYLTNNQDYRFSCSYILGMKFPGSAFECKTCKWFEGEKESDPPMEKEPDRELNILVSSKVGKEVYEFASEEILSALNSNEDGDAQIFIHLFQGKFCYDHGEGRWYKFTGHYWAKDRIDQATAGIKKVIAVYHEEAKRQAWLRLKAEKERKTQEANHHKTLEVELIKRIRALQSSQRKANVLHLAKVGPGSLGITGEEWDRDPMLLGCSNGVIDLRDASFRPGRPEDYIKTIAPVEWQGLRVHTPEWGRFLAGIFNSDWELILYIKRLLGYAITGKTTEHIYPIFYGENGRNGKGTLLETTKVVLGDLAGPLEAEMILHKTYNRQAGSASPDIMALKGKRLCWASETGEDRRLNSGKLKWLTGSDTLTGRSLYQRDTVTFRPTHKLFLLTNHKPKAPADDSALWSRIHLVPFTQSFERNPDPNKPNQHKADPDLPEKLRKETSGILAWLVDGCLRWQRANGTKPPTVILTATAKYRQDEDFLSQFIRECVENAATSEIQFAHLYGGYRQWCEKMGQKPIGVVTFGKYMKNRFESYEDRYVFFKGIRLIDQ